MADETLSVSILVADGANIHLDANPTEVTALAHADVMLVDGERYLNFENRTLHFNSKTGAFNLHIAARYARI